MRGNATSLDGADYDDMLTNFAPIAQRRPEQLVHFANQKEEIDLLIATDCISEGMRFTKKRKRTGQTKSTPIPTPTPEDNHDRCAKNIGLLRYFQSNFV